MHPAKGKINISKALLIGHTCIEAYEYLASIEEHAIIAIIFYEKAIALGKQRFGGEFLKENKGHFWLIHETRAYMRCLQQYADCLYDIGEKHKCIAILEELIKLNPNDNQGVRDQLLLYLIEAEKNKKFVKYANIFKDDSMTFISLNLALFAFKTEGETKKSNECLLQALKRNKFVAQEILKNKTVSSLPDTYGIGDKKEAIYYAYFAQHIWAQTNGALSWLSKVSATSTTQK